MHSSSKGSYFADLLHICSLRVFTKKYGQVYFVKPTQPLEYIHLMDLDQTGVLTVISFTVLYGTYMT